MKLMQIILLILFFGAVILAGVGYYIKPENNADGDLLIGLGVASLFFLWMPTFIYHRWKGKNVQDYMLNKENIEKMHEYTNSKKR